MHAALASATGLGMADGAAGQQPEETRLVETTRGGFKLVHRGHIFRIKHKLADGAKCWNCDHVNCTATIKSKEDVAGNLTVVLGTKAHSHMPTPDKIERKCLNVQLRQKATAQPASSVNHLAAEVLGALPTDDLALLRRTSALNQLLDARGGLTRETTPRRRTRRASQLQVVDGVNASAKNWR